MNIKKWYMANYPEDTCGAYIDPATTFEDLFAALDSYQDVYKYLGTGDSIIRERCFSKLAEIIGTDYDYIYEQWMKA